MSLIQLQSQRRILKVCPFGYQLPYLLQEIKTYNTLSHRGCNLLPQLLAYVFERNEDKVVGFICEELREEVAGPEHYKIYKCALKHLHSYGVVHGDINKFNIIITLDGPRFMDFEKAILDSDCEHKREKFTHMQQQELDGLRYALDDTGGWGRPWPEG